MVRLSQWRGAQLPKFNYKQMEVGARILLFQDLKKEVVSRRDLRDQWENLKAVSSENQYLNIRDEIEDKKDLLVARPSERKSLLKRFRWLANVGRIKKGKWKDPRKDSGRWWGKLNQEKEEQTMKTKNGTKDHSIDELLKGGEKGKADAKTEKKEVKAAAAPKKAPKKVEGGKNGKAAATQKGGNGRKGSYVEAIVSLLKKHPKGKTDDEIRKAVGIKAASHACLNLQKKGILTRKSVDGTVVNVIK